MALPLGVSIVHGLWPFFEVGRKSPESAVLQSFAYLAGRWFPFFCGQLNFRLFLTYCVCSKGTLHILAFWNTSQCVSGWHHWNLQQKKKPKKKPNTKTPLYSCNYDTGKALLRKHQCPVNTLWNTEGGSWMKCLLLTMFKKKKKVTEGACLSLNFDKFSASFPTTLVEFRGT